MIHTYLSLEYITIVVFGLMVVLLSLGFTHLNTERNDNKTEDDNVGYKSWKQKRKEYNEEEDR